MTREARAFPCQMRLVGIAEVERDPCKVGFHRLSVEACEKALEPQHALESLRAIADSILKTAPELPVAYPKFPRQSFHVGLGLGKTAARLRHENVGWTRPYELGCRFCDPPKSFRRSQGRWEQPGKVRTDVGKVNAAVQKVVQRGAERRPAGAWAESRSHEHRPRWERSRRRTRVRPGKIGAAALVPDQVHAGIR